MENKSTMLTRLVRTTMLAAIGLLLFTFSGCEKVEYFKSEKSIQSELNGSWRLVEIPRNNSQVQDWTFSGNVVYRTINDPSLKVVSDVRGTYSLNVKLTKSDIIISDFPSGLEHLNGNWRIVRLDKEVLVIATDHYKTTGLLQLEFVKNK